MILYPEAQRRAQEEIDRVVGPDRLPEFADREDLPHINAIFKECLRCVCKFALRTILHRLYPRWQSVLPIGVPHLLTEDDVYNGYFVPAGSIVAANQWCVTKGTEGANEHCLTRSMSQGNA